MRERGRDRTIKPECTLRTNGAFLYPTFSANVGAWACNLKKKERKK